MELFDYKTISDEAIQTEYGHILRRGDAIAKAVHDAYGSGRKQIKTVYVANQTFNSFASDNGDHYLIEVDSSVPLFLLILFGRLMSDETIMPSLDSSGTLESDYSLPFIADPINFDNRQEWKIGLNSIRSFAAGTLADICSTFVLCHEVGHIINGHIEGLNHYEGRGKLAELTSFSKTASKKHERRQAWEYDADAVAATLVTNFISELFEDIEKNERSAETFGLGKDTLTNILAITIVALFAFFSYMRGIRHKMHLKSNHPHPIVRAYYIRDMLYAAAKNRWDIDQEILLKLVDERLAEFMGVMEKMDIFDGAVFNDQYITQIDENYDRLVMLQEKYKSSCSEWSWINWD